jgi:hypothetical protein
MRSSFPTSSQSVTRVMRQTSGGWNAGHVMVPVKVSPDSRLRLTPLQVWSSDSFVPSTEMLDTPERSSVATAVTVALASDSETSSRTGDTDMETSRWSRVHLSRR